MKGSNIDRSVREGSPVPGVELYDNEDGGSDYFYISKFYECIHL